MKFIISENSLKQKGSEVENMLIAEYSYEEDIQVKQQEARQEGRREGRQEGLLLSGRIFQGIRRNPNFISEQIAREIGCTVEEVESARKIFGI